MSKNNNTEYGVNKDRVWTLKRKLGFNINNFSVKSGEISLLKKFSLKNLLNHKKQGRILSDFNNDNINFLKQNKSYRGLRHRRNLPVRGQRTHTNAKTVKKKY